MSWGAIHKALLECSRKDAKAVLREFIYILCAAVIMCALAFLVIFAIHPLLEAVPPIVAHMIAGGVGILGAICLLNFPYDDKIMEKAMRLWRR